MMTTLTVLAAFQLLLYLKKRCLLKALFFSVSGAALGWFLLKQLGLLLPLTEGTAVISALLGLPGVLLLKLSQLFLQP